MRTALVNLLGLTTWLAMTLASAGVIDGTIEAQQAGKKTNKPTEKIGLGQFPAHYRQVVSIAVEPDAWSCVRLESKPADISQEACLMRDESLFGLLRAKAGIEKTTLFGSPEFLAVYGKIAGGVRGAHMGSKKGTIYRFGVAGRDYVLKDMAGEDYLGIEWIEKPYVQHMMQHWDSTLLAKLYGLIRIGGGVYLLMENLVPSAGAVQLYDLKGSVRGAAAEELVKKEENMWKHGAIALPKARYDALRDAIATDVRLLSSLNMVDYSLLVAKVPRVDADGLSGAYHIERSGDWAYAFGMIDFLTPWMHRKVWDYESRLAKAIAPEGGGTEHSPLSFSNQWSVVYGGRFMEMFFGHDGFRALGAELNANFRAHFTTHIADLLGAWPQFSAMERAPSLEAFLFGETGGALVFERGSAEAPKQRVPVFVLLP